ncbi:MAG: FIST N-terminal domain-containing protein [Pseudomonadota bacterium]
MFYAAHATGEESWQKFADNCLEQLEDMPADANLGFLYVTDDQVRHLDRMLSYLRAHTEISNWVGSVGIGVCTSGQEHFDEATVSVLAGALPEESFRTFAPVVDGLEQFQQAHRDWYQQQNSVFGLVHGDPRSGQLPEILTALTDELDPGFLVGGLASSRSEQYALIAGNEVVQDGVSGVLLSDAVSLTTRLTQGCSPLGDWHEVTECQDNIIVKIDDRPALDVLKEEIGDVLARDLNRIAGYVFVAVPIEGSDTGDYLVRNLLGLDVNSKMLAIGDVIKPGDPLMFARRDAPNAEKDMQRMLDSLSSRLDGGSPKGGVYYTCRYLGVSVAHRIFPFADFGIFLIWLIFKYFTGAKLLAHV